MKSPPRPPLTRAIVVLKMLCTGDAWMLTSSKCYFTQTPTSNNRRTLQNIFVQRRSSSPCKYIRPMTYNREPQDSVSMQLKSSSATVVDPSTKPVLRTMYISPPTSEKRMETAAEFPSSFVTNVTSGFLSSEAGSPHMIYYEVHHRTRVKTRSAGIGQHRDDRSDSECERGLVGLVLHGGPGAGCFSRHVDFFSPTLYEYVVLMDQRGCGRSTPLGEVASNSLSLLVEDVERLRHHLLDAHGGNKPWDCILGGSWGCTLALAYAHSFPIHVRSMVLRGICLFRSKEIDWLFGDPSSDEPNEVTADASNVGEMTEDGKSSTSDEKNCMTTPQTLEYTTTASKTFENSWRDFSEGINSLVQLKTLSSAKSNRGILTKCYHLLLGSNPLVRYRSAQFWRRWEMGIYSIGLPPIDDSFGNANQAVGKVDINTKLIVWNPTIMAWTSEDARVGDNQSTFSIDAYSAAHRYRMECHQAVNDSLVQLLRRYSSPLTQQSHDLDRERLPNDASCSLKPLPFKEATFSNETSCDLTDNITLPSNKSTDPANYIPAQAMLTCYYCTNDDYVLHPYRSFLSLQNASWYSSKIPSHLTAQGHVETTYEKDSFPLPPCIAIQGGRDAICPPDTALDLHHFWKEMELRIALGSGHSMYDPIISGEIVKALDRFGTDLTQTVD